MQREEGDHVNDEQALSVGILSGRNRPSYESYATLLTAHVVYWEVEHFFAFV